MLLRLHAVARNSVVRSRFGSFGKYVTSSITPTVAASSRACFPAGIAHGHLLAHKATSPQHIPVRTMAGTKAENIVWSDSLLTTDQRALLTGCRGATIWLTGLSGSGKSTIGALLEKRLIELGMMAYRLDGDNVRFGLNKDLAFSEKDRKENIRRIGEVCRLFTDSGVISIASFISPYKADREEVRELLKKDKLPFFEVFVQVPLHIAESRDPKGLYKKARSGNLKGFTGIDAPYEEPEAPELVLATHQVELEDCVAQCIDMLARAGIRPAVRLDSVMGAP